MIFYFIFPFKPILTPLKKKIKQIWLCTIQFSTIYYSKTWNNNGMILVFACNNAKWEGFVSSYHGVYLPQYSPSLSFPFLMHILPKEWIHFRPPRKNFRWSFHHFSRRCYSIEHQWKLTLPALAEPSDLNTKRDLYCKSRFLREEHARRKEAVLVAVASPHPPLPWYCPSLCALVVAGNRVF